MPRPLTALALCSLACSVALAGLWAWSYRIGYLASHTAEVSRFDVLAAVARGELAVAWGRTDGAGSGWAWAAYPDPDPADMAGIVGAFGAETRWPTEGDGLVWCPLWVPALVTALPPAAWWVRRRRRGARGFEVGTTSPVDRPPCT